MCALGRIDLFVLEDNFASGHAFKNSPDAFISKLPVRTSIEVLDGDFHAAAPPRDSELDAPATRSASTRPSSKACSTDSTVAPLCRPIKVPPVRAKARR